MHTMSISVGIKLDKGDDLINIIHQTQVNVINEFGLVAQDKGLSNVLQVPGPLEVMDGFIQTYGLAEVGGLPHFTFTMFVKSTLARK